jgi:hypothetical protein
VYKAESYTEDNPVFLVRGMNPDGSQFEQEINVNNVDSRNASFVEMFALDGYFASKGHHSGVTRMAARAMNEIKDLSGFDNDAFTKFDFIHYLQEMMENHKLNNNKVEYEIHENIIHSLLNLVKQK